MQPFLLAAALLLNQQGYDRVALDAIRSTVNGGSQPRLEALFADKQDSKYLLEMAERKGGFKHLRAAIIPSPPGWASAGPYLVIIHQFQELEGDHDPVFGTVRGDDGLLRLGSEIVEDASPQSVRHLTADVQISPATNSVEISAVVEMDQNAAAQAPLFRLNDFYVVSGPGRVLDANDSVPQPKEGDLVRAGSLLIPWTTKPEGVLRVNYRGTFKLLERNLVEPARESDIDRVDSDFCYLTAYWVPSLGRNPQTTSIRVTGPKNWVLRSEGLSIPSEGPEWPGSVKIGPDQQVVAYRSDMAISFPKVIGGKYKDCAELNENGKTFRFFQPEPIDEAKGKQIVRSMADAMADFEKWLGPFPYPSYECFEGVDYDGIESYSYTVLSPRAYSAASHELGHTYFGGIVPCAYVRDSWNESLTQYIDSVVHLKNADKTLQSAFRSLKNPKPLSKMDIPWADGSATYSRGAYVMKMLEVEIGLDNVLAGLKAMVSDRRGKETRWTDIRHYMEEASKDPLDWFWSQWVTGGTFPTLQVIDAQTVRKEDKYKTFVTVQQSGTPDPFRLKFVVRVTAGPLVAEQFVSTRAPQEVFTIESDFPPNEATVDVFPYALATVTGPYEIPRTSNG